MVLFLSVHEDTNWQWNSWRETGWAMSCSKAPQAGLKPGLRGFRNVACTLPGHPDVFLHLDFESIAGKVCSLSARKVWCQRRTKRLKEHTHRASHTFEDLCGKNWQKQAARRCLCEVMFYVCARSKALHNTPVQHPPKDYIYFLSISHKYLCASLVTFDADEQKRD